MKEYTVYIPIHVFEKGNSNGTSNNIKIRVNAASSKDAKQLVEDALLTTVFSHVLEKNDR